MQYKIEEALADERWLAQQLLVGESGTGSPGVAGAGVPSVETGTGAQSGPQPPSTTQFLVARSAGRLHAAAALELRAPGLVSIALPPSDPGTTKLRADLLRHASRIAADQARAIILMLEADDTVHQAAVELGFAVGAEISFQERIGAEPPKDPLVDLGLSQPGLNGLAAIIELTLTDSRDCAALQSLLSADDMLRGFEQRAAVDQRHWYAVEKEGAVVGCLLLNEVQEAVIELMYMGVVPSARGRGLGQAILQKAWQRIGPHPFVRMVLAVDLANAPAVTIYESMGFREFGRRVMWLRHGEGASR